MIKNFCFICLVNLVIVAAGCQSQTDQFLSEIEQDIAKQQADLQHSSGENTTASSISERLLVGDMPTTATANDRGVYADYSTTGYNDARQSGKQIVFFSYATSSPTALALDASINTNRSRIPANVTIFKLDYDTSLTLNQQYAINEPSTIIVFDTNGEIKHQVAGGIYKIDSLLNYL